MFTFSPSFEAPQTHIVPDKDSIIEELRNRLRRSQGARFKAEAQLAILTVEREQLAARLKKLLAESRGLWV
jgi:hypothetical protein